MTMIINSYVFTTPAPGGFPQLLSITPTNIESNQIDHPVAMPLAVSAGELLIALMTFGSNTNPTITTPSGWTLLIAVNDSGFTRKSAIFYKVSNGSEAGSTVNFITSNNQAMNAFCLRVSGAAATNMLEQANVQIAGVLSRDPANLTPTWGGVKTLWFVFTANRRGEPVAVTPTSGYPFPDNQTEQLQSVAGSITLSTKEEETATVNPNNAIFQNTTGWGNEYGVIFTVGIKPA
jgi:hypothetical protein